MNFNLNIYRAAMGTTARILLLVPMAALAACAGIDKEGRNTLGAGLPSDVELTSVPFYPQEVNQCGPASLAIVLSSSGLDVRPAELVPQVYSPKRQGTLPTDIIAAARRYGRMAHSINSMEALLLEITAGNPVIVLQDLGIAPSPTWHFAVVIGFDRAARTLTLHSGVTPRKTIGWQKFERTWLPGGRWGRTILAPDRMPAGADEKPFLRAAAGLERARQLPAARIAYQTAIAHWPDSLAAHIGLGNSLYGLGQLKAAAKSFRTATTRHPSSAAAFNNLAHVLAELNRSEEAIFVAAEAIALNTSTNDGQLQTTLREVLAHDQYAQRRILMKK